MAQGSPQKTEPQAAPQSTATSQAATTAGSGVAADHAAKAKSGRHNGSALSIVNRPPVKRLVAPKQRRPAQAAAASAPEATNGTTSSPTSNTPNATAGTTAAAGAPSNSEQAAALQQRTPRKMWPTVPAAAATGAVTAGAAGGQPASAAAGADTWSPQEIEVAKARCAVVLRGIDAVAAIEDPIKEGECGSPVVYKVSSVGKGPVVELSPPVTLTCEMISALDTWMKRDVQPKARALLGGSIVRIDTMSSYSCRNAYGRTKSRLSEHGKANAIDISGFSTAKELTTVLAGWGLTVREEKAIAAKRDAERAASQTATGALPQSGGPGVARPGPQNVVPGVIVLHPPSQSPQSGLGLGPARLGGPKPAEAKVAPAVPDNSPKRRFLHEIHTSACRVFGTVLGPEANNAHKNHFHLDMAQRQRGSFCE